MACIPITNFGFICTNTFGRLHVGNKYVWVEYHHYCGPTFYKDYNCTKPYDPDYKNDPVWTVFQQWVDKIKNKKRK